MRDPRAEVVENAGEAALAGDGRLAHRQMQRKRRPVTPQSGDLAAGADDLRHAGREIPGEIVIVLLMVGRRHQHVDVAALTSASV